MARRPAKQLQPVHGLAKFASDLNELALPSEAGNARYIKQLIRSLGKTIPFAWHRVFWGSPKPFPIFIPLFYDNGRLVGLHTLDLVLILFGIVGYALYREKRKRDQALRAWETQVRADTQWYATQAAQAQRLADERNLQALLDEQRIRSAIERFEADDREEAAQHEAAKRALGHGGDWQ